MSTSVRRKKLLSSIRRLLTASESAGITIGEKLLVNSWGEAFLCSQFESRTRSFTNWKCGRTSPADLVRKYSKGTESGAGLQDIFHIGRVVSGEATTGCKFGSNYCRTFGGIDISQHHVNRAFPDDPSALIHSSVDPSHAASPINLAVGHLDALSESSSGRSSEGIRDECPRSALRLEVSLGSELGFRSQDYRVPIRPYWVSDLLWTRHFQRSIDVIIYRNVSSFPSLTDPHCKRTDLTTTDPSFLIDPNFLTFCGRGHRCGGVFPLDNGIRSHLYSTSGQDQLSGSKQDGDDSSMEEGATARGLKEAGGKTWMHRVIPEKLWPFAHLARLDKPIGTWLLAWPCFWSICLAAPSGTLPDLKFLSLFGLGAILLRGAGCTVNDLLDSDIDGQVERTKQRPIASGALTPFQGLSFLGFQLLLGLGVLLQLNDFSKILGASSLLLVGTYPLMKRWTFWPQAYLGLTFNWGALLGWAAVQGELHLSVVLPLYVSGVCWTLVYDTIYAHQDKEDDIKVGVKSTALWLGNKTQIWLTGFSAGCVSGLTLAGFSCGLGWPFYVGMGAAAGHLAWQVSSVDIHNRVDCNAKFVSNKWFGAIVCSAIVLGKLAALPA